ncbi:putative phage abortive infection protein [Flavobacterium celericrescens]|uniref:Phage abortive infection protein n=1 Tax=Flavobacterium celericrescens TaxID=2709780 RepID=A0ABX0IE24_9FLAO|nr:putative phage abortive infection protein [Flavobacterium celericrescens]NHM05448.1 hypothetical protein [Flavobacterium celericrescens]
MSKENEIIKFSSKLSFLYIFFGVIGFVMIMLPMVFYNTTKIDSIGTIGDAVGGILNPVIAIGAALLTFLAFYIQYQANRQVQEQFKVQQFESQFYEMLRLHKENVNSLYLTTKKKIIYPKDEDIIESTVQGRVVFEHMKFELILIYMIALKHFHNENPKVLLNEAYAIFFNGISETKKGTHIFFDEILELESYIDNLDYDNFNKKLREGLRFNKDITQMLEFSLFKGHSHQLAHYYRHLFQTVKFIVNQNESFISYEMKRNFLRILRSQLSNTEQTLLFYNWYSNFGKQWEDDNNKYFTDYRMIHNLFNDLLISQFKLEDIFDLESGYRKEVNRKSDSLFEFQDW